MENKLIRYIWLAAIGTIVYHFAAMFIGLH